MTTTTLTAATTPGGGTFAPAFSDDATVRPLDLGAGLDAQVRTDATGTVHVLTVHNTTDEAQTIRPEDLLPEAPEPLLFLGGQSTSDEKDGRIVALLEPHTHVHLGRLTAQESV